jgi:putative ABC transport system permease protein
MDELFQDVRYGFRQLIRRPGFSAVLVLTLALGIGANTAVFSVVNGVLLDALPYPDAEELAVLWTQFPTMQLNEFPASEPEYTEFRDQNRSFEYVAGYLTGARTLTGGDTPERLQATISTWQLFPVLGVDPILGRVFTEAEDTPGDNDVVVLSHRLWQGRFGADPSLVGQTVQLDGTPMTVLGVMPPAFEFPTPGTDLWIPRAMDPANPRGRTNHRLAMVGRLNDGVTVERAAAEMEQLIVTWDWANQRGHGWAPESHPALIRPLHEQIVGDVRTALWVLLGAVGVVLLIACANVANLLLVRGEGRIREISIRTALGAQRRRIIRQLVTESVITAAVGGVAGVALGYGGVRLLLALAPTNLPRIGQVGLNTEVLIFSAGVTLVAGLIFGLAPAFQASRVDVQAALREEGRGGTVGQKRFRLRQLLVVSETALALVLLITAGLLIQSFWRLKSVDPGFNAENVLSLQVSLPGTVYPDANAIMGFYGELMSRARALPAVTFASAVRTAPLDGSLPPNDLDVEGFVQPADPIPMNADIQMVAHDYFRTLGIPLLSGRTFEGADNQESPVVAVVSQTMADRYWPGADPIGKLVRQSGYPEYATVVGLVSDVHQEGLRIEPRATLYFLHEQGPRTWYPESDMTLVLRTGIEPLSIVRAVRREVANLDRDVPVYEVRTMAQSLDDSTATERFSMLLQMVFALVALALAAIGIYGVISYSVAQRTHEIGIRMALGAQRDEIVGMVVGQGMKIVFAAATVGVVGALFAGSVLSSLLFGIQANDPLTFAAVTAVLILVAFGACFLPARRASSVDPQQALRYE